jgi:RNA polymerase sigma-70 factor (ECF subfamily)
MGDAAREALWVLRAQVGDREALEALLRAVQEPLFRYAAGLTGEPHLAEDVLQEVFLRIYRKVGWLREPALFRPWCYRICTREALRRLRRERWWRDQLRGDDVLGAVAAPEPPARPDPELVARLPELIGQVSPASRAVLALHYLDHQTIDEVARALGLAVGTVKSRLAHGLTQLRRACGGLNDAPP